MADDNNPKRKPLAETAKGEPKDIHAQGTGATEQYQRGGSGSEGGFATDESHGHVDDLSSRGGGTGEREIDPQAKPEDSN